jgi:hypothetical protein
MFLLITFVLAAESAAGMPFDVWPAPTEASFESNATLSISSSFSFTMKDVPPIMADAFARYEALFKPNQAGIPPKSTAPKRSASVSELMVVVTDAPGIPQMRFKVNETYTLTFGASPILTAATVFGALVGPPSFCLSFLVPDHPFLLLSVGLRHSSS